MLLRKIVYIYNIIIVASVVATIQSPFYIAFIISFQLYTIGEPAHHSGHGREGEVTVMSNNYVARLFSWYTCYIGMLCINERGKEVYMFFIDARGTNCVPHSQL